MLMDDASRMARAKEMGFMEGMPLYHGTGNKFEAFRKESAGSNTNNRAAQQGAAWMATEPGVANAFAEAGTSPQVLPLLHQATKPGAMTLPDDPHSYEVASSLADAFDDGYDAVMLKNYRAVPIDGKDSTNIIAVKEPTQVRSRLARFDPRLKHISNLSAGVGGLGIAIGSDAERERIRRYLEDIE